MENKKKYKKQFWWYGHFLRSSELAKSTFQRIVPRTRRRERQKKKKKIAGRSGTRMHNPGRDSESGGVQRGMEQIGG